MFAAVLLTASFPAHAQAETCEAAYLRVDQLVAAKDFDGAVDVLNQLCAGDAATAESRLKTARILSWAGRYGEAEALFDKLLTEDPGNLDVLVARGSLHYYQSELCLLYTSPSPRDQRGSRMPSSA